MVNLMSQKMGIRRVELRHQVAPDARFKVPLKDLTIVLKDIARRSSSLSIRSSPSRKRSAAQLRCGDGVRARSCAIECDACVDICPVDCITFTANGEEGELRAKG